MFTSWAKYAGIGVERRRTSRVMMVLLAVLSLGLPVLLASPASAVTCAAANIAVTPLHGDTFYTDDSPSPPTNPKLTGNYEGYRFTNNTGAALTGVWSKIDTFNAGPATSIIGLAPGEDGIDQLDPLSSGAVDISYFFLGASPAATDLNAQTHSVRLYDRRPDLVGAVELCATTFTYARVIVMEPPSAGGFEVTVEMVTLLAAA